MEQLNHDESFKDVLLGILCDIDDFSRALKNTGILSWLLTADLL